MTPPYKGPASGRGLLDARALWASIVGPQRLAMGAKQSVVLSSTKATKIGDNIAAADAYVLIGVRAVDHGTPTIVLFSKDDSIGVGSGFPVVITGAGASFVDGGFTQLLLPGEQLFAQLSPEFGGADARVTVSQVTF